MFTRQLKKILVDKKNALTLHIGKTLNKKKWTIIIRKTRQNRISRLLQKELASIFQSQTRMMHGVLVSVTRVRISPDLSICTAYLSIFPSEKSEELLTNINANEKTSAQWVLEGDIKGCFDHISHEWIVISEWSLLGGGMMNRRDYAFNYMVGESQQNDLFSDLPCDTFEPVHFLNLNRESYGE